MKQISILILALVLTGQVRSQEKTDAMLFGDVKSAKTQEHIPYSTIRVKSTNIGTTADGTGHFKMANLPVGKCIIVDHSMG